MEEESAKVLGNRERGMSETHEAERDLLTRRVLSPCSTSSIQPNSFQKVFERWMIYDAGPKSSRVLEVSFEGLVAERARKDLG